VKSTTYDFSRYLGSLARFLSNDNLVDQPTTIGEIIVIRRGKNGRKSYWDVNRKRVILQAGAATVDIRECGEVNREGRFRITEHSYHFQPRRLKLYVYRIDLERSGELHANCDESLVGKSSFKYHMRFPGDLGLDISDFNSLLALVVALHYVNTSKYPLDPEFATEYNTRVESYRRQLA
jgi:hypothetical protein